MLDQLRDLGRMTAVALEEDDAAHPLLDQPLFLWRRGRSVDPHHNGLGDLVPQITHRALQASLFQSGTISSPLGETSSSTFVSKGFNPANPAPLCIKL